MTVPSPLALMAGSGGVHQLVQEGTGIRTAALDPPGRDSRSGAVCPGGETALDVSRTSEAEAWGIFVRRSLSAMTVEPTALPIPSDGELVDVWCTDREARDLVVALRGSGVPADMAGAHRVVRVSANGAATLWAGEARTLALAGRQLYIADARQVSRVDLTSGEVQIVAAAEEVAALAVDETSGQLALLRDRVGPGDEVTVLAEDAPGVERTVRVTAFDGAARALAWLDPRHLLVATDTQLGVVDTESGDTGIVTEFGDGAGRSIAVLDPEAIVAASGLTSASAATAGSSGGEDSGRPRGTAWVVGLIALAAAVTLFLFGRRWVREHLDRLHR